MKGSPLQKAQSSSQAASVSANAQLSLLYQLEQRKVTKLESENRALRERINNLLSKEDEERIELLVADKTRRKLVQLRAITERTIKSLESGLKEFRTFVDDIDDAMEEQERNRALQPLKIDDIDDNNDRILRNFNPTLQRIPESPMMPTSTSKLKAILDTIHKGLEEEEYEQMEENDTVDETPILDEMEVSIEVGKENNNKKVGKKQSEEEQSKVVQSVTVRSRSAVLKGAVTVQPIQVDTPAATVNERMSVQESGQITPASSGTSTPQSLNSSTMSGRAKRAAAVKINSYKLPSLNKKMRREH